MTHIAIAVQARSTSQRLPNKIQARIGGFTVLQHVLRACQKASLYLNNLHARKMNVSVFLLIPFGDPIRAKISENFQIIEGPENDVLSRYMRVFEKEPKIDYICRVTSDCPMIPHFVISKVITLAVVNDYDYVSNVDERCRTSADGMDCEVISQRAFEYANGAAIGESDREHVTTFLRTTPPPWLRQGTIINFLDLSHLKLSVDTEEDLERVRKEQEKIEIAYNKALEVFGKTNVHRF